MEKGDLQKRIKKLEYQVKELSELLNQKETLLKEIYSSKTWRLGQLYGRIFGVESIWRKSLNTLLQKFVLSKTRFQPQKNIEETIKVTDNHYRIIEKFIEGSEYKKGIIIVIAGVKMTDKITNRVDQLSHRAIRLAKEFNKMGYQIFFVYKEKESNFVQDELIELADSAILKMHISLFLNLYEFIFNKFISTNKPRILLIQTLSPFIG